MGFQRAPRSCATPLNECPLDGGMPRPNGPKMGFYHGFNDSKGFLSEDLSEHGIEQVVNSLDWFRSPYVENTEDLTELSLYLRDAGDADFDGLYDTEYGEWQYMSVSGSLVGGNAIPCYNGAWLGEPLKTEAEISLLFVLFCRGDDRWITEFGFDDLVGVPMQSGPDLTTREYNPIEPGVLQQLMHAKGEKFVIPGEGSENHEEYYCKHGCGFKSDYESMRRHEMKGHGIHKKGKKGKKGSQKPTGSYKLHFRGDQIMGPVGSLMLIVGVILVWVVWGATRSPYQPPSAGADLCGLFVLGVIGLVVGVIGLFQSLMDRLRRSHLKRRWPFK